MFYYLKKGVGTEFQILRNLGYRIKVIELLSPHYNLSAPSYYLGSAQCEVAEIINE